MPFAGADDASLDGYFDAKDLVVVGADRLDQTVLGAIAGEPLRELLQAALGTLKGIERALAGQFCVRHGDHEGARGLEAEVKVERPYHGLEGRSEERRSASAATLGFALPEQQILSQSESAGQPGQACRAHDRSSARRKNALIVVGMATIEGVRNSQTYNGVTEEFQALVVADGQVPMLVQVAAVNQRLLKQLEVTNR
jgi:hypothetical protein